MKGEFIIVISNKLVSELTQFSDIEESLTTLSSSDGDVTSGMCINIPLYEIEDEQCVFSGYTLDILVTLDKISEQIELNISINNADSIVITTYIKNLITMDKLQETIWSHIRYAVTSLNALKRVDFYMPDVSTTNQLIKYYTSILEGTQQINLEKLSITRDSNKAKGSIQLGQVKDIKETIKIDFTYIKRAKGVEVGKLNFKCSNSPDTTKSYYRVEEKELPKVFNTYIKEVIEDIELRD